MAQIIALFNDAGAAESAIDALVKADLDGADIRTIDEGNIAESRGTVALPALAPGSGAPPGVAAPVALAPSSSGMEDSEWQFFQRAVEGGGILIVVDTNDEEATAQAQNILQAHGGRTTF